MSEETLMVCRTHKFDESKLVRLPETSGKPVAVITVGVSASGKTTWALNMKDYHVDGLHNPVIICRDDLRIAVCKERGVEFSWKTWRKLTHKGAEKRVTELQQLLLSLEIAARRNIILADTNLNHGRAEDLRKRLEGAGYDVWFKHFPVSWETAVDRDTARQHGVGTSVLAKQFEQWYKLCSPTFPNLGDMKGMYIIVDVDGTLAEMDGRSPYEWDKVGTDLPRYGIVDMVLGMYARGYDIEIVSGRDGACFKATMRWLKAQLVNIKFVLSMRAEGDMRPDDIVKRELFATIFPRHLNCKPTFVVDDRPRVCREWRRLGIDVLQVGNPYIEF